MICGRQRLGPRREEQESAEQSPECEHVLCASVMMETRHEALVYTHEMHITASEL